MLYSILIYHFYAVKHIKNLAFEQKSVISLGR